MHIHIYIYICICVCTAFSSSLTHGLGLRSLDLGEAFGRPKYGPFRVSPKPSAPNPKP